MTTLYHLADEFLNILEACYDEADSEDGRIGDEMGKALDEIQGEFAAKAEGCCRVLTEMETAAEAAKIEAARLATRSKRLTERSDWLRNYIKEQMTKLGMDELRTELFKLKVCNSPEAVKVLDEDGIPARYFRIETKRVLEKDAIKTLLKAGGQVPGTELSRGTYLKVT